MKKIFYLCITLLASTSGNGQDVLLQDPPQGEAELHVAINPTDSNNIVVAVQRLTPQGSIVSIYYTYDFGQSWSRSSFEGHPLGFFFSGDPVLAFDASGELQLATLVINDTVNFDLSLIISKSLDGGKNWQIRSYVSSSFPDKPWLAIDNSTSSNHMGNIYVPAIELSPRLYILNSNYTLQHMVPLSPGDHLPSVVVNSDGDVFVSTLELSDPNRIYVHKINSNNLSTVEYHRQVASFPDFTFNAPNVSYRFQPTAYMAVDKSGGTYDGRLYICYTASEQTNSDYFNVYLQYSDDEGLTWSTPKIVHSDITPQVDQFYSSIYVNDEGELIIDWYDRKDYAPQSMLTDFYLGVSTDGGNSFSETKLTSAHSDFQNIIHSNQNFCIGEYHQVVSTNNTAIAFWSDGRKNNGDLNVYFAKVNLDDLTQVTEKGIINTNISLSTLHPVPARDELHSTLSLRESTKLKYEIYNSTGQVLSSSDWKQYGQGDHELLIDLDLSSGVYMLRLLDDQGFFLTRPFTVQL